MKESPIPQEHPGIPTKAKVIAGVTLTTAAIGGAATMQQSGVFDGKKDEANVLIIRRPEQPTSIPGTEIPNPLKTPEVTAVPTQKTGFSEKDGAFTFRTEKGEVLNVPQIEGLTAKKVKVGEVEEIHYFAKAENKYRLDAEAYAGKYKPNVDIYEDNQRKELGAVSLNRQVVQEMLVSRIAEIPTKDKWLAIPPVEIAEINDDILLSFEPNINTKKQTMRVSFGNNTAPLINIILGTANIKTVISPAFGWAYLDNFRNTAPNNEQIAPGREMSYLVALGQFSGATDQLVQPKSFGERVAGVSDKVYVSYGHPGGAQDVYLSKMLTVDNIPVFLQSTGSEK